MNTPRTVREGCALPAELNATIVMFCLYPIHSVGTGSIPEDLGELVYLKTLDLRRNKLTGNGIMSPFEFCHKGFRPFLAIKSSTPNANNNV